MSNEIQYNYGSKHIFTNYGKDDSVILSAGKDETLTIQGSLNIIDKMGESAGITLNGAPVNVSTSSALYLDNLSDVQVITTGAQYLNLLVLTGGGNWTNSNYVGGLVYQATTAYDFAVEGQDYVWCDLIGNSVVRNTGTTVPDYTEITGSNGWYSYEFPNSGNVKYLYYEFHVPHDYKYNSNVYFHVHWCNSWTTSTDSGVVEWEIKTAVFPSNQAQKININYNTVYPTTYAFSSGMGGQAIISETHDGYMSGDIRVDDLILVRLSRYNGVGSNYSGSVWVQMVDLHYQSNKVGTKNKVAPFYS